MSNERKLIPFMGKELEELVNPFLLRVLILVYIVTIPFILWNLKKAWDYECRKLDTVLLWRTTPHPYEDSYFSHFLHGDKGMPATCIVVFWILLYWLFVFLIAKLLQWLFVGKT